MAEQTESEDDCFCGMIAPDLVVVGDGFWLCRQNYYYQFCAYIEPPKRPEKKQKVWDLVGYHQTVAEINKEWIGKDCEAVFEAFVSGRKNAIKEDTESVS